MATLSRRRRFDIKPSDDANTTSVPQANNPNNENDDSPADYFDGVYEYINQMLLEEDDAGRNSAHTVQICSEAALQAAEKYFHDALASPADEELRIRKKPATCTEEAPIENYENALLCPKMNPRFYDKSSSNHRYSDESSQSDDECKKQYRKTKAVRRGRPKGSRKNQPIRAPIDHIGLLTRCAESVLTLNVAAAGKLIHQIRTQSSFRGDANERLAHCFANALEARIAGTGSTLCASFSSQRKNTSELLRSYKAYASACPFKRMSNIFANKSIAKCAGKAAIIHVIDFGIEDGFQWPCLIHGISLRPGGAPRLKITGVDFPQPGFKPAEGVEETGLRLAEFCKRFNVDFEYNAVVKKWDDVRMEDLKIGRDEVVVVNCLYRQRHMPDEYSQLLRLIEEIKPSVFVNGVVNGTYDALFFGTRFREALFHYSAMFDMMEAVLPREDEDRGVYEREVLGREVMNVIACEGSERVERPGTYKQWHGRNERGGLRQKRLDKKILREIRSKVKKDYHKDFLLEEERGWMLQGWKGRVMYALSCWKPIAS